MNVQQSSPVSQGMMRPPSGCQPPSGFCPASLCRLLRGIAAQGGAAGAPVQASAPQQSAGQSFTIAAILGLKRHDAFTDCPSGVVNQQGRAKLRQTGPALSTPAQPSNHHSSKSKRVRTIFTPEQLERLEAEFERQQYMVGPERLYLAHALQLTEAQVKVWFQNRRIKWRKQHLELTQQRLALARRQQLVEQVDNDSSCSLPDNS